MLTDTFPETPIVAGRTTSTWRLFVDFDRAGPEQMALDEALLDAVGAGAAPAVRFYTWSPPTLSLGVNQTIGEVDREAVEHYGFGLVRRLTGGRAVLHQHELTYSVVAPEGAEQVSGGVVESYRKISTALVEGLRALGAEVDLAPPNRELRLAQIEARAAGEAANGDPSHAVCFDAASDYELTAGGRKLVGSAQARRAGVVLQHGSILLDIDWDAWANVFAYRTPEGRARAAAKLRTRMTSLSEQLGRPISPGEVAGALAEAFARHFHVDLTPGTMAEPELAAAATLAAGKYSDESWTARK